jgi:hypothetical protein
MKPATKKWLEAGKILAADPSAIVRCPERDDGILRVHDAVTPDGKKMERYMVCNKCGSRNILLMRIDE